MTAHPSHPDQLMAKTLGVCWHSPTADRWPCTVAPPADVEKAARAIWESDGYRPESWGSEDVTEHTRDEYRANARAALSAVRPSPDSEVVARVAAVLPRLDREARISSFPLSFGYEDSARLIRAALGTGDREGQ